MDTRTMMKITMNTIYDKDKVVKDETLLDSPIMILNGR